MKTITVVMSAYNGSRYIVQQLDSIFAQKGVDVTCFVRDDGSKDDTLQVLEKYQKGLPKGKMIFVRGENVGWERSFLLALRDAPQSEYYAFADQDDIWFVDKLQSGIKVMESVCDVDKPLMYHCNKLSVNEELKPFSHQVRRTPQPLNRQNAMIQEYAQGCSIIMNEKARKLVLHYVPHAKLAHDFWCGLVCYLFGKVIYDNAPRFYHISHGNNASGEGHTLGSWYGRLKSFSKKGNIYYSPYDDLIEGYNNLLSTEDKRFIEKVKNYRHSVISKLFLLFSPKFVRDSIMGTLSLKLAILFNRL